MFTKLKFSGSECILPTAEEVEVKGQFVDRCTVPVGCEAASATHKIEAEPCGQTLFPDKMLFGKVEACFDGAMTLELSDADKGKNWAAD